MIKRLNFYLYGVSLIMLGCSSHNDVVSVSESHYYNEEFGLLDNNMVDKQIEEEVLMMSLPTEVDMPTDISPEWTVELTKDPDAFYAHEYVQEAEVITYKYEFDEKFYKTAEWRSAEF